MKEATARYLPALAVLPMLAGAAAVAIVGGDAAVVGLAAAGAGAGAAAVGILTARGSRARQALAQERAARRRLETLLDGAPDAWAGWSAGGTRTTISPGFCRMLGIDRCDRPEEIEAALAPSDAAAFREAFAHLHATGRGFQLSVQTADGERTLQTTGRRGRPPDGARAAAETCDIVWLRDVSALAIETRRLDSRRGAAEALAQDLRTALDVVPYPIWLRRQDLSLAWVNAAYAKAIETTAAAAAEEQREFTAGVPGSSGRDLARQAHATGTAQSESVHLVVNGQRRLFEITEAPIPAPAGSEPLVVGYAIDATSNEDLRNEVARHVSAHAEMLEQLGSAIAIFGPDTRLRFYNHAYLDLWEFEEAWLDTEPTYAEVLDELRTRRRITEHADFKGFRKEQIALFTSLIEPQEDLDHLPDGRTLRRLVVPHPFGGLMFILEDVTNALALESSYNTLMAVQQETLDNLAEGIAVFGGDGRLKLSNPAYGRIWKLDDAALNGEPHVVELIERMKGLFDYGDDWESFRNDMIGNALDRTARSGRIARADGSTIEFANVPLPDGAVLNSFLDVTDTQRVEHALRERNAALETADRLKAEFIANVSYQLRTPLNAIMGFAEILANQYFGPLNERQLDYCRAVLDSGNRLLLLINDILDLATVEAGFMVLERRPVDLAALLASVANLTREWGRKQDLRIDVECDESLGSADADEKRLKQALFNLISNSIKFTPAGGRIVVAGRRRDGWIELSVSDTGIGIAPDDQGRVFDRFERAHPNARQAGVGLGLSLVKSFVELHGGRVEIESRINEGTTVRCLLPASPTPLAVAPAERRDAAS